MFTKFNVRSLKQGRTQRGMALINVIAMIFMLATIGVALASVSVLSVNMAGSRHHTTEAFDIAEAGFRHAVKSISEDEEYGGTSNLAYATGTMNVSVSVPNSQPDHRWVISTGKVKDVKGRWISQSVSGLVSISEEDDPGSDYAILADHRIEISGDAKITSAPAGNEGHIHSNGKLKVSGNPQILGEGSVVGQYEVSGTPTYSGGLHTAAAPVNVPWPDFADLKADAFATGQIYNGTREIKGTDDVTLSGVITGNLKIADGAKVKIVGPVWVLGEADLKGNTQITGDGGIICEQKMTLGGEGGFQNDPSIDNRLILASMKGGPEEVAIDMGGPVKVKAGIFAPNGKINVSGELDVWGLLRAKVCYISGQAEITKNTKFNPFYVEPQRIVKVQYWKG